MTDLQINEEVLTAYLRGELNAAEAAAVEAWYDASAANRRLLGEIYYILYVNDRINDTAGIDVERSLRQFKRRMHAGRRISLRRITLRAAAAAAVAVILLAGGVTTVSLSKRLAQPLTVITHLGERSQVVLPDGTKVWLNAGTRLEYPLVFAGGERRVKVAGEAMFDVEHDPAHPFVVETFACDVEVLGTKFNVTADELTHDFTTALLRGKVKVTNKLASGDQIILDPNEKVCLNGNRLVLTRIENTDDYLWTEGILNLVGHPFADIIAKMEKTYGVKIQIQTAELPQIDVIRGKIPVNMGLDYALRALQKITPFQYEKDENNVIHIK